MNKVEWKSIEKIMKSAYRTSQINGEQNSEEFLYHALTYAKYRFGKTRDLYPLRQEVKAVESFLACSYHELGPGFDHELVVDEGLESILIPRFCVLALVERCNELAEFRRERHLRIRISKDHGLLSIRILDTAVLATRESFLNSDSDTFQNLSDRIQASGTMAVQVYRLEEGSQICLEIKKRDGQIW